MSAPSLRSQLLRRKPVSAMVEGTGAQTDGGTLARRIGPVQLMGLGIGATIGTGIFFVLSTAVPEPGPAVVVSFVLAAVTAGFTALCCAELASTIPVAGSSYSYAYATLGRPTSRLERAGRVHSPPGTGCPVTCWSSAPPGTTAGTGVPGLDRDEDRARLAGAGGGRPAGSGGADDTPGRG